MVERRENTAVLLFTMTLALMAHLAMRGLPAPFLDDASPSEATKPKPPVEITREQDLPDQPVVQSSRVDEPDAQDAKARHFGEFRNRVKKETQSEHKGRYLQGGPPLIGGGGTEDEEDSPDGQLALRDLLPYSQSPNAFSDDIEKGGDTVLNTETVVYASFINRIADEIYDSWSRIAQEAVMNHRGGERIKPNEYITKLGITLNAEGDVTSIQLLKSSGIDQFDEAPRKAFWECGTFPNPPKQLLQADGFIRLAYTFSFNVMNPAFSIFPQRI